MPQSVTHFLIPVILLELFRQFFIKDKKRFPVHYVFIGGIAGLIPDFDIAVYYLTSLLFGTSFAEIHRTFSHNLFVPLLFVVFAITAHKFKNKELGEHHLTLKNIFLVIAFGILVHLILDAVISGAILPFYPISSFAIGLNLIKLAPLAWQDTILPSIDAVLLIFWMIYLEAKHKISRFI